MELGDNDIFSNLYNIMHKWSLNEIVENAVNKSLIRKKNFCRIFHDLCLLRRTESSDYPDPNYLHIEEIDINYQETFYREYFFFLYAFIYYDYNFEKYSKLKKLIQKAIESNIDEDTVRYSLEKEELIKESNINIKKGEKAQFADYLLFREFYPQLALFKGMALAYKKYEDFQNDKSLLNEIMDVNEIEKRIKVRKHEVHFQGTIHLMYLTYKRSKYKSHATRVRNYETDIMKQQETEKYFSQDMAKSVISEYYRQKHYNSKLKIDEFLENQDVHDISRRTFFSYKKYYDNRVGKGKYYKNTEEKAYDKYLIELEKNPHLKIDAAICKRLKVGQKKLKIQIEKENNRV